MIENDFLYPSNCKIYGRKLRYSEQILPIPLALRYIEVPLYPLTVTDHV